MRFNNRHQQALTIEQTLNQTKLPAFCSYNLQRFRHFRKPMVEQNILLLGVDGGGTQSRARLSTYSGGVLAEAVSGPANLRLGIGASFSSVVDAARRCLDGAGIAQQNISRIV